MSLRCERFSWSSRTPPTARAALLRTAALAAPPLEEMGLGLGLGVGLGLRLGLGLGLGLGASRVGVRVRVRVS